MCHLWLRSIPRIRPSLTVESTYQLVQSLVLFYWIWLLQLLPKRAGSKTSACAKQRSHTDNLHIPLWTLHTRDTRWSCWQVTFHALAPVLCVSLSRNNQHIATYALLNRHCWCSLDQWWRYMETVYLMLLHHKHAMIFLFFWGILKT